MVEVPPPPTIEVPPPPRVEAPSPPTVEVPLLPMVEVPLLSLLPMIEVPPPPPRLESPRPESPRLESPRPEPLRPEQPRPELPRLPPARSAQGTAVAQPRSDALAVVGTRADAVDRPRAEEGDNAFGSPVVVPVDDSGAELGSARARTNAQRSARLNANNGEYRRLPLADPRGTDAPDVAALFDRFASTLRPPPRSTAETTASGRGRGRGTRRGVPPRAHLPPVNREAPAPARAAMLGLPTGGDDLRQAKEWWVREYAAGNLYFLSEREPGQSATAPKVAVSTWADISECILAWPLNAPEDGRRAACFLLETSHRLLFEAFRPGRSPRGGDAGRRDVVRRMNRFMGGEWESLVDEARERQAQPARQAGVGTTPSADPGINPAFTRARRLARVGELSRAAQALDDTKVVQGTPDTIAALQAKHPAAPPAASLDADEDAWERAKETLPFLADIQPADIIKALKSATKGAAQYCMGWRVESLQAPCAFPDAIEALTSLVRALARGDLNDSATELLTRARLVALAKEDGGLRPIGICAVFRNLVGQILLSAWREDLDAHLTEKGGNGRLLQLAVGVPRGTQICCTHIAEYLRLNPAHVAIEGDVRNAFNEVWRTAIVEGIMALGEEKGRSLLPFFLTVYGMPSKIAVRGADGARHFVDSQVGSTQGDVLGMLLFCLAIHPILRDTARENPDAHQAWYADNGYHLPPPRGRRRRRRAEPTLAGRARRAPHQGMDRDPRSVVPGALELHLHGRRDGRRHLLRPPRGHPRRSRRELHGGRRQVS